MLPNLTDLQSSEEARMNALRDLRLLDTPPSESFDRITRLASRLLGAPVSTISLTDRDRQWFKSRVGVDLAEIPREQAPCNYAIRSTEVFVVKDLREDPRFRHSPLAQAGIRFYAGAPLHTRAGYGLGTLCVVDDHPRDISTDDQRVLQDLAGMVLSQIELQNTIGCVEPSSGFPNQYQFFEDIEALARRAPGQPALAILVDLASSAQVGQGLRVLGADYVDRLMRGALARIAPAIQRPSRVYHVTPTRFALVMSGEASSSIKAVYRHILARLADPIDCGGVPVLAVPVIGHHVFLAGQETPRDILRRLFSAAEDARMAGVSMAQYDAAQDERHRRSFALVSDFHVALQTADQLSLAYQPRFDIRSGRCVGAEALLRWRHPQLGAISPAEFIPVIEQTALVRPMTDWVVARSIAEVAQWRSLGVAHKVSVNASALNLDEDDFADRLIAQLERSGLGPDALELEFTESAMARDGTRVTAQLSRLRDAGIDIAIDDFGTGHSNLAYLQSLPASVLKIDRAFVKDAAVNERDHKLARTMVSMAHDLGYRVVAEGIETREVYDLLESWGCDEGQGWLMGRPMAPHHLRDLLRRDSAWHGASPGG
jgi:EAL domain-containing protein (putative c-di-GMP-specific phosphodiesterase class I)